MLQDRRRGASGRRPGRYPSGNRRFRSGGPGFGSGFAVCPVFGAGYFAGGWSRPGVPSIEPKDPPTVRRPRPGRRSRKAMRSALSGLPAMRRRPEVHLPLSASVDVDACPSPRPAETAGNRGRAASVRRRVRRADSVDSVVFRRNRMLQDRRRGASGGRPDLYPSGKSALSERPDCSGAGIECCPGLRRRLFRWSAGGGREFRASSRRTLRQSAGRGPGGEAARPCGRPCPGCRLCVGGRRSASPCHASVDVDVGSSSRLAETAGNRGRAASVRRGVRRAGRV